MVDAGARSWFVAATSASEQWPVERVLRDKERTGLRVSVVIPARNEQATIADVVGRIRHDLVDRVALVDELVVMDSLSSDDTAARARDAGARVHAVGEVAPDLGTRPGKGEALWKSLFVTSGDVLVFVDADLTDWGTHFVTALSGPLLADPGTLLVKGFYDRILEMDDGPTTQGGRVTELVARPLLALHWPQLGAVVQPLAGEWSIRRELMEQLPVPIGYGVEFATLVDTVQRHGLPALAQVDLGRRAHRHQSVHDLAVMATEILAVAARRVAGAPPRAEAIELAQYTRDAPPWRVRPVPVDERQPAGDVESYRNRRVAQWT